MTNTSPTSNGYATALMFGSIFLLVLGLLLIFVPDLAGDSLTGTGPVMFLAGVVAATGYCIVGAFGSRPPAASQPTRGIATGWYLESTASDHERYWDGNAWTQRVRERQR